MSTESGIVTLTLRPASHWRVLLRLFNLGFGRTGVITRAGRLMHEQDATWENLCDLWRSGLITSEFASTQQPVDLPDVNPDSSALVAIAVRLTSAGKNLLVGNRPSNVIAILAQNRPPHPTCKVKNVRTSARCDDFTLIAMDDRGLISGDISLASFKRIPDDLMLRITPKGRRYWPN